MDGGYWRHYEFESDEIRVKDLRRFREYEAFVSMTYEVPVITTVVCSADIEQVRSCMEQGINTYKVEVVQLKQKNADQELQNIWRKLEGGCKLSKVDLVAVALLPLMSGVTGIYDRCCQGFRILQLAQEKFEKEEIKKLQAMLYTLACKFLTEEDLIRLKEAIDMTVLGKMLMNDGIGRGENLLAMLMNRLLSDNRVEDAMLATNDEKARKQFYKEYGLVKNEDLD